MLNKEIQEKYLKILYKDTIITCSIDVAKRKHMYITVKDQKVTVKIPLKTPTKKLESFVNSKIEWIYNCVEKQKKNPKKTIVYGPGEIFKILGKSYIVKLQFHNKKRANTIIKKHQNTLELKDNIPVKGEIIITLSDEYKWSNEMNTEIEKQIKKMYFTIATEEVEAAMNYVTSQVGLSPNEYKIKVLKSAWGICSSSKKISINVEVVQHNREFVQYVVLHEICHLKYMNHSKDFWDMVEYYMPNYKNIKNSVK